MRRTGLKDKLIAYVAQNPAATPREIATALNCHEAYVRSTARRQGLTLARTGKAGRPKADAAPVVSRPRLRIKAFRGTPEQYDALARLVPLIDLGPRDCRWPVGDPKQAGFGFCGHVRAPGKSYCDHHQKRSEGAGTRSERNADDGLRKVAA